MESVKFFLGTEGGYRPPKCIRGSDRLSELPDGVIVHILSFLPTLDAVRTVLLRRFGNLWTLLPTLDFSDDLFCPESDEEGNNMTALHSGFSLFVRNVLILHKRPTIDKFLLYIGKEMVWDDFNAEKAIGEVEMWIRFALSRDVKALTLGFKCQYFIVPESIYTSQSLVMLELRDCQIEVTSPVHMGSLRTLVIHQVVVDESLNELVIGCPSLKELVVDLIGDIRVLRSPSIEKLDFVDEDIELPCTIDCPNLKILDIDMILGYMEFNVPTVREVTVNSSIRARGENLHEFKRFLEGFQSAEVLKFTRPVDQQLTYCSNVNVGFPKNGWKRVVLPSSMLDIAGICSLVRNSPCLEELIIHTTRSVYIPGHHDEEETATRLASQEASSPCVVPCLKVVSMHGYGKPYKGQLQFTEFLLKSAVNLDKLIIFSNGANKLTSTEEVLFLKRLSKFPRASTHAMIVFE